MFDPRDQVIARARVLLANVTFDSYGIMIGMVRQGGNGGLLSNESLRAADELRKALAALDAATESTNVGG